MRYIIYTYILLTKPVTLPPVAVLSQVNWFAWILRDDFIFDDWLPGARPTNGISRTLCVFMRQVVMQDKAREYKIQWPTSDKDGKLWQPMQ